MNTTEVGQDEEESTVLAVINVAWGWINAALPHQSRGLGSTLARGAKASKGTGDGEEKQTAGVQRDSTEGTRANRVPLRLFE